MDPPLPPLMAGAALDNLTGATVTRFLHHYEHDAVLVQGRLGDVPLGPMKSTTIKQIMA